MWSTKTGLFPYQPDMDELESKNGSELLPILLSDSALVAMRSLAEIMLNDGFGSPKLHWLLRQSQLTTHWHKFASDKDVNDNDKAWARQLGWSG